jgi:hypothetical protein
MYSRAMRVASRLGIPRLLRFFSCEGLLLTVLRSSALRGHLNVVSHVASLESQSILVVGGWVPT